MQVIIATTLALLAVVSDVKAAPSFCSEPAVTGMCRAHQPRFYYNVNSGQCEEFIYGGCGGNANNFGNMEACTAKCVPKPGEPTFATRARPPKPTTVPGLPSRCYQDSAAGDCSPNVNQMLIRYYYNRFAGICQAFTWSGCGGNSNKFDTALACQQTCKAGQARAFFTGTITRVTSAAETTTHVNGAKHSSVNGALLVAFLLFQVIAFLGSFDMI